MVPTITSAMFEHRIHRAKQMCLPSRVRDTTTEKRHTTMSHPVISRAPRPRRHLALIDAIAHADDIDQVNTLVNQAGYETYEAFWTACEAEFAAR